MQLAAADEFDDFHLVTFLEGVGGVLFSGDDVKVHFYGDVTRR